MPADHGPDHALVELRDGTIWRRARSLRWHCVSQPQMVRWWSQIKDDVRVRYTQDD